MLDGQRAWSERDGRAVRDSSEVAIAASDERPVDGLRYSCLRLYWLAKL